MSGKCVTLLSSSVERDKERPHVKCDELYKFKKIKVTYLLFTILSQNLHVKRIMCGYLYISCHEWLSYTISFTEGGKKYTT